MARISNNTFSRFLAALPALLLLAVFIPINAHAASGLDGSVSFLLHANGTDASISIPDSSTRNPKTVSANGNAQLDTAQSKFGGASILFDGTGDSVTPNDLSSDFAFGTGDFTIDFWFRLNATGRILALYDARPNETNGIYPAIFVDTDNTVAYYVNSTVRISGGSVTTGVWYHVALVRSGSSTKLFLDGTQIGSTYTDTNNYLNGGAARPLIGGLTFGSGTLDLNGWIDELRVSKGVARWTSNFMPPTAEYGEDDVTNRYDVEHSLQFNSANSRYLSKNFWTVGSTTKWTFSTWVKRASTGTQQFLLEAGITNADRTCLVLESGNTIYICQNTGNSTILERRTSATYTSTSDWYHIVLAVDTSQATAANRVRLYVNGTEVTSFSSNTIFAQNTATWVTDNNNNAGSAVTHLIGKYVAGSNYFDGLMADVILVDGQQLPPSVFGRTRNGAWLPIEFTGITGLTNGPYGTNGFRFDFSDSSQLGKDRSGRGNDFILVNIGSGQQSTTTPTGSVNRSLANLFTPSARTFINGAVFINGDLSVAYNLSKGAGSFVIDHVLNPMNKLLYHSFVESPDAKNIYDGITILDNSGVATVELPKYFMALNRDYRYLGSPIG